MSSCSRPRRAATARSAAGSDRGLSSGIRCLCFATKHTQFFILSSLTCVAPVISGLVELEPSLRKGRAHESILKVPESVLEAARRAGESPSDDVEAIERDAARDVKRFRLHGPLHSLPGLWGACKHYTDSTHIYNYRTREFVRVAQD